MGVVGSIRGVLWARKRRPDQPAYLVALAHERFQPDELVEQAVAAERAGFDGVCCSDHLEPWWAPDTPTPAACGNAWVWLGAVGQATSGVSIGTAVDEHYTDAIADTREVGRNGEELSDSTFEAQAIVSADPETPVKKIRMLERLGATAVCVMNVSGDDPLGMLRSYGADVLPALRAP